MVPFTTKGHHSRRRSWQRPFSMCEGFHMENRAGTPFLVRLFIHFLKALLCIVFHTHTHYARSDSSRRVLHFGGC